MKLNVNVWTNNSIESLRVEVETFSVRFEGAYLADPPTFTFKGSDKFDNKIVIRNVRGVYHDLYG